MKVLIEARSVSAKGGGVKRYTENLVAQLAKSKDVDVDVIYDRASKKASVPGVNEIVIPLRHELLLGQWLNKHVTSLAKKNQIDLMHFTKADVPARKTVPTVVTIHDVIPLLLPGTQSWSRRWYWPRAFARAAKQSDHILTISEASKGDIVEKLQVDKENVTVARIAIDGEMFKPQEEAEIERVREKYGLQKKYIFFVGTRDIRKNVAGLVRAFSDIKDDIDYDLVIAGTVALKHDIAKIVAAEKGVEERVDFIDFVEEEDLPAMYAGADLFVWPSIYEGWGLPPQEAMACGTATIVSDGGSLPEVVGEAGMVVHFNEAKLKDRVEDYEFEQKLGQAMLKVLTDDQERERLRVLGIERVKGFTWQTVAEQTISVYKQVLS